MVRGILTAPENHMTFSCRSWIARYSDASTQHLSCASFGVVATVRPQSAKWLYGRLAGHMHLFGDEFWIRSQGRSNVHPRTYVITQAWLCKREIVRVVSASGSPLTLDFSGRGRPFIQDKSYFPKRDVRSRNLCLRPRRPACRGQEPPVRKLEPPTHFGGMLRGRVQ